MALYSVIATVDLNWLAHTDLPDESQCDDVERLLYTFGPYPTTAPSSSDPLVNLRVSFEFDEGGVDVKHVSAVHIKVITGAWYDAKEATTWCEALIEALPAFGPQIVAALAQGMVRVDFDSEAEGWTLAPEGGFRGHAALELRRDAAKTLLEAWPQPVSRAADHILSPGQGSDLDAMVAQLLARKTYDPDLPTRRVRVQEDRQ